MLKKNKREREREKGTLSFSAIFLKIPVPWDQTGRSELAGWSAIKGRWDRGPSKISCAPMKAEGTEIRHAGGHNTETRRWTVCYCW